MEFRLLGPLEAWHDEAPVPLGDLQQRFILVVLLLHANRPVSSARITDIIWGDTPDRRDLVRLYIKRLRDAFQVADDVSIETTPTGYVLRVHRYQLDTQQFDRLCIEAEAARADDPHWAAQLLRDAVSLRRGPFLEDIDVGRVGGPKVILSDDAYHDAVGDLAELELTIGDHRLARDRLRPIVSDNPTRERHAALLVRALLADGDRAAAVRVFDGTRHALAELGMKPNRAMRSMAWQAAHREPSMPLTPRPFQFTTRGVELSTVKATANGQRGVRISGAPGVGEPTIAVEAAYRPQPRFHDGQIPVQRNRFTLDRSPTTHSWGD